MVYKGLRTQGIRCTQLVFCPGSGQKRSLGVKSQALAADGRQYAAHTLCVGRVQARTGVRMET
jgi:hypothetical protein